MWHLLDLLTWKIHAMVKTQLQTVMQVQVMLEQQLLAFVKQMVLGMQLVFLVVI